MTAPSRAGVAVGVFQPKERPDRDAPAFARLLNHDDRALLARADAMTPEEWNAAAVDIIYHYFFRDAGEALPPVARPAI